jgi:hypothetical protein
MRFCVALSVLVLSSFRILAGQIPERAADASANGSCGLVYGKGHAFFVCAPKGWVLDNGILNDDGIYAAFYPESSSWAKAKEEGTVMYVNTAKKGKSNEDVASLMKSDAADTKANAPKAEIHEAEALKTKKDAAARVQQFTPGSYDRFEAVAYIDSPEVIVMIVMTSKDSKTFKRDYPAFKELVGSYEFMTTNVQLPK